MSRIFLFLVLFASFIAAPVGTRAQSADELFRQALVRERTDGDLQGAIDLFERVARVASDRSLAAQALVRVGQNYERLGLERALDAYRRIVSGYSDQAEEVRVARERLAALAQPAAGPRVAEPFSRTAVNYLDSGATCGADLSPDGTSIAISTNDGVGLIDVGSDKTRTVTTEPHGFAQCVRFSPDGSEIAFAGWDEDRRPYLKTVNLATGAISTVLDVPAFMPDVPIDDFDPYVLDWKSDASALLAVVWGGYATRNEPGRKSGWANLLLVPLDGSSPTVIATNDALLGHTDDLGCLSTDGRYAFLSFKDGPRGRQFVARFDLETGSSARWRADERSDVRLVGCPDGRDEVLYVAERVGGHYLFAGRADADPAVAGVDKMLAPVESTFDGLAATSRGDILARPKRDPWGRVLAVGLSNGDGTTLVSELHKGSPAWLGNWDPAGTRFSYGTWDPDGSELHVWDSTTGETMTRPLPVHSRTARLQWMPDGRRIVIHGGLGGDGTRIDSVSVLDLDAQTFTAPFSTGNRAIWPGADGSSLLASVPGSPCIDRLALDGSTLGRFFCIDGLEVNWFGLLPIPDFSGYGVYALIKGKDGIAAGLVNADGTNARLTYHLDIKAEQGRLLRQLNARTAFLALYDSGTVSEFSRVDAVSGERQRVLSSLLEYIKVSTTEIRPDEKMVVVLSPWTTDMLGLSIIHNVLGGAAQK